MLYSEEIAELLRGDKFHSFELKCSRNSLFCWEDNSHNEFKFYSNIMQSKIWSKFYRVYILRAKRSMKSKILRKLAQMKATSMTTSILLIIFLAIEVVTGLAW